MSASDYRELTANGLWKNNPAIVQLLGLCPLLAVTGTVVNAIGLGLATLLVLLCSNVAVSLIRHTVSDAVRLPTFVMIIAAAVTCIELLMQAFTYELYQILGIFLPLITTNCVILGRADGFASKNPVGPAAYDALMMGLGFGAVLIVLGAIRELAGTGMLFSNMDLLFGPAAAGWEVVVFATEQPFLLAVLPPGAFIFTGLLIALKNIVDAQLERRRRARQPRPVAGSKRVRVTGAVN
jgi:electron transport complex protein RnfE